MTDIKTKVIFKGLTLLAFTFFGTQAIAQKEGGERPKPPTYAQLLEEMDSNKDGKLAKSEVKGPLSKDFGTIDSNKDGFISKKEFDKAPRPEGREK